MKKVYAASAATAALTLFAAGAAQAGGLDRSGQDVSALFESGSYVETSAGYVSPSVSGTAAAGFGSAPSGNVAPGYTQFGFAFKTDLNPQISLAIILDQPFGANVDYATAGYILNGAKATVSTNAATILGRYKFSDNVSIYAGPRIVTASGNYTAAPALGAYSSTYSSDMTTGYVVGAAYEIPAIALRAAITYSSETSFSMAGTLGDLTATMPQSINFDFQTGIAKDTLAFASIRWVNWANATIDDSLAGNLADFNNEDTVSYEVGIGHKFSDQFSAQISFGYEAANGLAASNLAPTDGYYSVGIGGAYDLGNGMKISGGLKYVMLGDATTETIGSSFSGNSAIGVGLKLSYAF